MRRLQNILQLIRKLQQLRGLGEANAANACKNQLIEETPPRKPRAARTLKLDPKPGGHTIPIDQTGEPTRQRLSREALERTERSEERKLHEQAPTGRPKSSPSERTRASALHQDPPRNHASPSALHQDPPRNHASPSVKSTPSERTCLRRFRPQGASPSALHQDPPRNHASPSALHQDPPRNHASPSALHQDPPRNHASPSALHQDPPGNHASPSKPQPCWFSDLPPEVLKELDYTPHSAQQTFHESRARFKVLIAGSRFGKSRAAAMDVLPYLFRPNTRGWIVAKSYRQGEKELRYLVEAMRILQLPYRKLSYGGAVRPSCIILDNGAEVLVVSARDPSNLLGEELDWLILSEASQLKDEVWTRYLRTRLATREGRLIIPTTPAGPNWVQDLFQRGGDDEHPQWQSFHAITADNPFIPPEEIEEARRTLPERDFREQFLGEFVTAKGLVYHDFTPSEHVFDPAKVTVPNGTVMMGIDVGFSSATCVLKAVKDGVGRLWVTDEHYAVNQTHADTAQTLKDLGWKGRIAIDPAAPDMFVHLARIGCSPLNADNRVLTGIDQVRTRLRRRDEMGKPWLMFSNRCRELLREIAKYVWDSRLYGESHPVKKDDHALDALRYLVMMADMGVEMRQFR